MLANLVVERGLGEEIERPVDIGQGDAFGLGDGEHRSAVDALLDDFASRFLYPMLTAMLNG